MLELKNLCKRYVTGNFVQDALKDVSISFRRSEFVAILGHSGSGKTTMLNIIGGLDRYDSGDLVINGRSTKSFSAADWDAYRNNSVGFIFQSYHLIGHISLLANVEMGMTLSGVPAKERRQKALDALERVGLRQHARKRPNQLSGGQQQRVAIARALANDPDIILADEPTGAVDSQTSVQIMDLIREISKEKLVIMVTHNPELAARYATRTIEVSDGRIISDTAPVTEPETDESYRFKRTAMKYTTALKLSFTNILTKKFRTLLTAFASSIGIIGIALIMSLSNGFDQKVKEFEATSLSQYPILIMQQTMEMTEESMAEFQTQASQNFGNLMGGNGAEMPSEPYVYPYDPAASAIIHDNRLSDEYVAYLEKMDPAWISGISYTRATALNLLVKKEDGQISPVMTNAMMTALPKTLGEKNNHLLKNNYDLLAGEYPQSAYDMVLVVDGGNRVNVNLLNSLGIAANGVEQLSFDAIVGKELKLVPNDDYYVEYMGKFIPNQDLQTVYNGANNHTLRICGIVRVNPDSTLPILQPGLAYPAELSELVVSENRHSAIVLAQQASEESVIFGTSADAETLLSYLGGNGIPYAIMIYPTDFDTKDHITDYLDAYNQDLPQENAVVYTDMASMITALSGGIMDAITIVLIAFSSISLIVSVIMIAIITYISVLERTKEIGILRALGARSKDITRVFNAETSIIGLCSGLLGVGIAWLLTFPANAIIENLSGLPNVAQLNPVHALAMMAVSLTLTLLGGLIPAMMAAKRDPVLALRAE
ncbi:MAG: ABC transporter ATP-binding protein/permease [Clostridia bacterium]|nr:ABC transporter ATP-binding protein/permease [Clostridia bacterium]